MTDDKTPSGTEMATCLTSSIRQWGADQRITPRKDKVRCLIRESPSDWWEYDAGVSKSKVQDEEDVEEQQGVMGDET